MNEITFDLESIRKPPQEFGSCRAGFLPAVWRQIWKSALRIGGFQVILASSQWPPRLNVELPVGNPVVASSAYDIAALWRYDR
jgi:hypothetical protein